MLDRQKIFAVAILVGTQFPGLNAGTIVCDGTVDELAYHANNRVMIKLSSMNEAVFFCNTDDTWQISGSGYTTSPGACKTMYSTFLTAKTAGNSIHNMWFDGDQVPETCDSWQTWPSANIRYFTY